MALLKAIKQEDEIITNYHRVDFINFVTNKNIFFGIISYIDEKNRKLEDFNNNVYKKNITYGIEYKENATIKDIYEYLKNLPEFENALDV